MKNRNLTDCRGLLDVWKIGSLQTLNKRIIRSCHPFGDTVLPLKLFLIPKNQSSSTPTIQQSNNPNRNVRVKKRKRKRRDWNTDVEKRPHHKTVDEQIISLLPGYVQQRALAVASVFGLFKNDINAESAYAQRCPKCDHHTLVRERAGDPKSPWRCNHCGNDADEFGNKL